MPKFGLGLYLSGSRDQTFNAIKWAFDAGYRLFDTAQFYGNEREVGEAVKALNVERPNFFVTSKLWTSNFTYEKTLQAFDESLKKLNLEYIDLFLLHYPVKDGRKESWRALEKIYDEGLARAIGVSNFMEWHLDEFENEGFTKPMVNQVECHPWLSQVDLIEKCKDNYIIFQGYSPLAKGQKLNYKPILELARKYEKSYHQILLRWGVQKDICQIPKSSKQDRIISNSKVFDFEISAEDMNTLNSLNEDYHCSWDPTVQD